jgi:hypothetical protein
MISTDEILMAARRSLYALRTEGVKVNPTAAAAVTAGRHGPAGEAFAAAVRVLAGDDADEAAIVTAIETMLQEGTK